MVFPSTYPRPVEEVESIERSVSFVACCREATGSQEVFLADSFSAKGFPHKAGIKHICAFVRRLPSGSPPAHRTWSCTGIVRDKAGFGLQMLQLLSFMSLSFPHRSPSAVKDDDAGR